MAVATTERMLEFILPAGEYTVIDTMWALSRLNRRAYRQGFEVAYDKAEIFQTDAGSEAYVTVSRLPNTWVTVNSWVKGYHMWKEQQDEKLEETDSFSTRAAYRDFKICYNYEHLVGEKDGVTVNTIDAIQSDTLSLAAAQAIDTSVLMSWEYSEFVVPNVSGGPGNTIEYYGYMIGDDAVPGKGLIKAYAESRARPFNREPSTVGETNVNIPPGGLYAEMQDVGEMDVEIRDNIRYKNDEPPYLLCGTNTEFEMYPFGTNNGNYDGITFDTLIVRASSILSTDATGPFTALCGLLWFYNGGGANTTLRLHVSPGPYKGIMARSMLEAN